MTTARRLTLRLSQEDVTHLGTVRQWMQVSDSSAAIRRALKMVAESIARKRQAANIQSTFYQE